MFVCVCGTYYTFISVSIWGEGTTGGLCGWGGVCVCPCSCRYVSVYCIYVSICIDDLP